MTRPCSVNSSDHDNDNDHSSCVLAWIMERECIAVHLCRPRSTPAAVFDRDLCHGLNAGSEKTRCVGRGMQEIVRQRRSAQISWRKHNFHTVLLLRNAGYVQREGQTSTGSKTRKPSPKPTCLALIRSSFPLRALKKSSTSGAVIKEAQCDHRRHSLRQGYGLSS